MSHRRSCRSDQQHDSRGVVTRQFRSGQVDLVKFTLPIDKISGLRNNVAVRTMTGAFALRIGVTIANLALVTLAARMLSGHDFGTYSMLFSAAGLLSVIATFGQQIFITRAWSEFSAAADEPTLKGAMTFSALASFVGVILVGLPFFLWFAAEHDTSLALAATLYLVCYSLLLTSSHFARNAVGVWVGDGLTYLRCAR